MPTETILGASRRVALLDRRSSAAFAPAAEILGKLRVEGYHRIKGNLHVDAVPAVGFPRVRQSVDGLTWSIVDVINRDLSQADFQFPFDFQLRLPYVEFNYTQGAGASTFIFTRVFVIPAYGVGDDKRGSSDNKLQIVRSDKDVEFTGAIAANDQGVESLTGLNSNIGVIESITLTTEDNLDWEVHLWATDGFSDADLDADSWIEQVSFAAADGVSIANAVATTFRYAATGLSIPYVDRDGTNELHVSLVARNGAKAAGAAGEVVLEIAFRAQG